MDSDQELILCNFIEAGLCVVYDDTAELTDAMCVLGLDNAVIALKHHYGFAKNETVLKRPDIDAIVESVVDIGAQAIDEIDNVTLKDVIGVIHKIQKSVLRHSEFGPRAYYEFVRNYI